MMAASPPCAEQKKHVQVMGILYGTLPNLMTPPPPHPSSHMLLSPLGPPAAACWRPKDPLAAPAGRTWGLTALPDLPQPGGAQITGEDGGGTRPTLTPLPPPHTPIWHPWGLAG